LGITATLALLAILLLCIWLYSFSYAGFQNTILHIIDKPHIRQAFEQALPPARFACIQKAAIGLSSMLLLLNTWLLWCTHTYNKLYNRLRQVCRLTGQKCRYALTFNSKAIAYGWYALLLSVTIACVYVMAVYPITIDEAVTYVLFSSKGPLFAVGYYPAANNHVLYSLITTAFVKLPLLPVLALRLSLLPGTLLLLLSVTYLVKKHAGEQWVLPALLLLVTTPAYINYSVFARGYIYVMLFTALALCLVAGFAKNNISRQRCIAFTLVHVLGCYTVLTYLYFMLPLYGVLILVCLRQKQYVRIRQLLVSAVVVALLVLLLFTPVLVTTGMQAAITLGKQQLQPSFQQQLAQLYDAVTFNISASVQMSVLLLAIAAGLMYKYGYRPLLYNNWLWVFAGCMLFMLVLLFVFNKRSMERNWVHLAVILPVTLAVLAARLYRPATVVLMGMAIVVCGINLVAFFRQTTFLQFYQFAKDNRQTAQLLHASHAKKVFFDEVYIKPMLDFYDHTNGMTGTHYYTNDKDFLYAAPFNVAEGYDFIIQINNDSHVVIPPQYRLAQKAINYTVWQLKAMP
jgi:hypothetical protein